MSRYKGSQRRERLTEGGNYTGGFQKKVSEPWSLNREENERDGLHGFAFGGCGRRHDEHARRERALPLLVEARAAGRKRAEAGHTSWLGPGG